MSGQTQKNLIKITPVDNSSNPTANYDYGVTPCYFNTFLFDASNKCNGAQFSFLSTTPNINLKKNIKLRDINLYYSSNFVITKKIHDINNTTERDLELIIEHTPDSKNTDQSNLYTCFLFNNESRIKGQGFQTMFESINTNNIQKAIDNKSQANIDNYKLAKTPIQINSDITNNKSNPSLNGIVKDAIYYLDNSFNTFIVFNHVISISCDAYNSLSNIFNQAKPLTQIFPDTNAKVNVGPYTMGFFELIGTKGTNGFTTLTEGYASLREGVQGMVGNYVYCRPSDTSNGNSIVSSTLNTMLASTPKDTILLNDVMMIFIIMIVFIFMCLLSPMMFLNINKMMKFNPTWTMVLRAIAGVVVFGGGFFTIIVGNTAPDAPSWLPLFGLIILMCYILFYLIVYSFQKNMIYTQLTDLVEDAFEEEEKERIKYFRNYMFGEIL